jgi:hypothetical protein
LSAERLPLNQKEKEVIIKIKSEGKRKIKMGEKDIIEKTLESYNDVFADIINGLLFQGEQVIGEDELEDRLPRTHYKVDGKLREMERDVLKQWKRERLNLTLLGLENQTAPDPDMPLRVMGYDGTEYRAQLNEQKTGERYPVITLVLYFGYEKRWSQGKRLLERLKVPEKFRPYVNDYKINVFEIAYLSRDEVELFKSDFRVVADYFVQKREKGDYKPEAQELKHVQETLQLLSVMTGDRRFEEVYNENSSGRSLNNMCEVLDRIENRGRQEGLREGRREGLQVGRQEGLQVGRREGRQEGENAFALLMQKLFETGRVEDAKRATENKEYRHLLMKELSIFPE